MPLSTLRSSARATPRGLLGSNGAMIDHSKSVSSYRRAFIQAPPRSLNHISHPNGIPFMSLWPRAKRRSFFLARDPRFGESRHAVVAGERGLDDARGQGGA